MAYFKKFGKEDVVNLSQTKSSVARGIRCEWLHARHEPTPQRPAPSPLLTACLPPLQPPFVSSSPFWKSRKL